MNQETTPTSVLVYGAALAAAGLYAMPAGATVIENNTITAIPTDFSLLGYSISLNQNGDKLDYVIPTGVAQQGQFAAVGDSIGSANDWSNVGPETLTYKVTLGAENYVGLRFDAGGGDFNYAFVETYGNTQLLGFAYESEVNTPITVYDITPVPEPASLALLASGMVGVAAYRRRRATVPPG